VAEPLIEIVPNFSEGRRREVMDALVEAISVPGARLLFAEGDADHNRLDTALVGAPEAVRRSALAGAAAARDLIDMTQHSGGHPRMGALDVLPFVPVRDASMQGCVALARDVAREIGEGLGVPVYLYAEAALSPDRRSLADVRRGEFEGLREDVARGERMPDFGPRAIGRAGATAAGARKPLVAFNMYLEGSETGAKEIARSVRESGGGLPTLRAVGFAVPERGCVTVSMNLTDHEVVGLQRAFDSVSDRASALGMVVLESEIVGLVPSSALPDDPGATLLLRGFDRGRQILEAAIDRSTGGENK
jgi:glutamate formiminotransferase